MTLLGLAFCLTLLSFGSVSAVFSMAFRPAIRRAVRATEPSSAALFTLRYAPTLAALLVTALIVLPAFLRSEPRHTDERIGPLLLGLACAVLCVLSAGPLRALRSLLATRRLARLWRSEATAIFLPGSQAPAFLIDEEFPLIAVVGILRPRLYVARQVLRGCTREEMEAIVRHESSHIARRDNLKRILLTACPDFLVWDSVVPELERAWNEARERAADDCAARQGARLDLASALVKVARMIRGPAPAGGALTAFCRGDEIAVRVRRLLGTTSRAAGAATIGRLFPVLLGLLALTCLLAGLDLEVRHSVHAIAESIVHSLQ